MKREGDPGTGTAGPGAAPAESLRLEDCVPSPRGPLYFLTWRG